MAGRPNDKWLKTMVENHGSLEKVKEMQTAIGKRGGLAKVPKGFASQKTSPDGRTGQDRARAAGSIGGKRSKRGHKFIKHENGINYYTCNITGQLRKYREV